MEFVFLVRGFFGGVRASVQSNQIEHNNRMKKKKKSKNSRICYVVSPIELTKKIK
jgi:hypothetical protein